MSGKNKLVPRLLGVTKESIIRVDERTKDVRVCFCRFKRDTSVASFDLVLGSLAIDARQTVDRLAEHVHAGRMDTKCLIEFTRVFR